MAESKSALLAKTVQKHAGRAKEKVAHQHHAESLTLEELNTVFAVEDEVYTRLRKFLQNLGKVDRTLDDIFEEHLQNFNRQHLQATRLQKEFNNYIRCIRAVQTASKSLMEAITEVYESSWSGHDLLYVQAQNMEMLWQDFSHKLGDQVLIPINTYTNQFPEVRKKIEKRGRKLVDYDGQRHSFQNLQASSAKRKDDVKISKGRDQLEEAKRTYEVMNSELHDELPALYDSRVLFCVNNLQTLFTAEQLFHSESSKVFAELEAITDKLATDCQRGSYKKPLANNVSKTNTLSSQNGNATVQTPPSPSMNGDSPAESPTPTSADPPSPTNSPSPTPTPALDNGDKKLEDLYDIPVGSPATPERANNNVEAKREVADSEKEKENDKEKEKDKPKDKEQKEKQTEEPVERSDDVYDIPVGATLADLPAGTLYRVRATYRYTREDSDELSFDVGDVIRVVEYDDPEEQEEGWLMGIKETTNEKGMFPANFTRPI